ncbi:hypothetical protein ACKGJO_06635 [Gracilimonas sp. Q87]|uniref:hypothetical protein n=1 Tax=Gracilimonas sp. Q87 TaxID=3384766 RepID=UPI0039844DC0
MNQSGVGNIIQSVLGADLSPEDKDLALQKLANDIESQELTYEDRKDARSLYKKDDQLQKLFAITFLVSFMILTAGLLTMLYQTAVNDIDFSQFTVTLISAIWGGMSAKVNTIIDFLFGGSFGKDQQDREMTELAKWSNR